MIRTTLIPVFLLLATQASAHADKAVHLHGSSTFSVVLSAMMGLFLVSATIASAVLIRMHGK